MTPAHAEIIGTVLSNFAPTPITIDGVSWPTTEAYYQAMKTEDASWRERIRLASTPRDAKALGRRAPIRPTWEQEKEAVMLTALRAKVAQHPRVREALIATGDKPIRESSSWDGYWGIGRDGKGANRLGVLWMQVRAEVVIESEKCRGVCAP